MTQILSCITPDYVIQVSDRCLSDARTGEPIEQEANKAVVLSNRVALAYTGLARINDTPADVWLRDTLVPHESIGHAMQLLADEATRTFAALRASREVKRQAFLAAGWARFPHIGERLHPFGLTISNALDEHGQWLPRALPKFSGRGVILRGPRDGYAWTVGGLPLALRRQVALNRLIGRLVSRGVGPASMARALIDELGTSADYDRRIGRGLLVNSIPQAVTRSPDLIALSGVPTETELCFTHVRHDGTTAPAEGPHFVRPGGRVFCNFRAWDDGDTQTVQVDLLA